MRLDSFFRSFGKVSGVAALAALWLVAFSGCGTVCTPIVPGDSGSGGFITGVPQGESAPEGRAAVELQTVYFDYDRAEIRSDQRAVLQANAEAAIGSAWKRVVVEGHCDERGSEEYNIALGARRAQAVQQYLIDNGVPADKLDTVSFGEANPAVRGHDESAWSQNRRASFSVVD